MALFLDHQNLLQTGGKFTGELRFQRPHHANLVQANADAAAGGVVQPQVQQGLARVVVSLAARDQPQPVVRALDHVVVQAVGADVGQRGVPLVVKQAGLLLQRMVGPADVQAAVGNHEVSRNLDLHPVRVDHGRGAGLDDLLDRLHTRPDTGEAAHRKRVNAQVQNLLHVGRKKHRRAAGLEDVVALVGGGGAFGDVVVSGHGNYATPLGRACHIGMLKHIRAAVYAGALAVPDAEHPVVLVAALGRKAQLLRAPQCGGGQLFVDAGLKHHMVRLEILLSLDQRLVIGAQWRAAVAADKTGGVLANALVAHALQHGQFDQGLHTAHESMAVVQRIFVV